MPGLRGGARLGAGRKPGQKNKATVEREIRARLGITTALDKGLMPLDVILARMRAEPLNNGKMVSEAQYQAAVAAAPYLHPRLAAATVKGVPLMPVNERPSLAVLLGITDGYLTVSPADEADGSGSTG